jgi:hypothetical protein
MAAGRPGARRKTIGADKNYDTKGFVAEMRRLGVTPHVAQNTARSGGSAIDGRTTRHEGYAKSIIHLGCGPAATGLEPLKISSMGELHNITSMVAFPAGGRRGCH